MKIKGNVFFKKIFKSPIFFGSLYVVLASVLGNFASYLLHLILGRILTPSDYGLFSSLISLTYYLSVPVTILNFTIIKFISPKSSNKKYVIFFLKKVLLTVSKIGFISLIIFLSLTPIFKRIIKTDNFYFIIGIGLNSFLSFYSSCFISFIQGLKDFARLAFLIMTGNWLRFIFSVIAGLLGFGVGGIIYSMLISTVIFVVINILKINQKLQINLFKLKNNFSFTFPKEMIRYSIYVLLSNISLTSLLTADLILARFYLSPQDSGYYSALSVLGRIIFFASSPVVSVLFPITSGNLENKEKLNHLKQSLLAIFLISLAIFFIFTLFPKQMILILYGKNYVSVYPLLYLFSISFFFYSLNYCMVNFFLSCSRLIPILISIFFSISQILLINFSHRSIEKIIKMNIVNFTLFFLVLIVYLSKEFLFINDFRK